MFLVTYELLEAFSCAFWYVWQGLDHSEDVSGAKASFLFLLQSWEFGIPLCRELACQYESLYDYQSLSWIRVSFAPRPASALTGSAHAFLASASKGALTEQFSTGLSAVDSAEEAEAKVPALKMQNTHLTDDCMIQTPRATGAQGREQQHMLDRMGVVQGGGGSPPSRRSFSWNNFIQICLILVFPCLGLWSLLSIQVKKVLPVFDAKHSKLSEMDFEGLHQIFPCFWCWVLNHNSWLSLWQREVSSSASCTLVSVFPDPDQALYNRWGSTPVNFCSGLWRSLLPGSLGWLNGLGTSSQSNFSEFFSIWSQVSQD